MGLREIEIERIRSLFFAGHGVRAVSRISGVSTHTAAKYRPANTPTQCPCGRPLGHSGRCAEKRVQYEVSQHSEALKATKPPETRLERSQSDAQRFLGGPSVRKSFNFVSREDLDEARRQLRASRLPGEHRHDIEGDIVLGLLEGRFGLHEIEEALYWVKRKYFEYGGKESFIEDLEHLKTASTESSQEYETDVNGYFRAADSLPGIERKVFVMSVFDDMNILEIAQELNLTVPECGYRLRRAYAFVRDWGAYLHTANDRRDPRAALNAEGER